MSAKSIQDLLDDIRLLGQDKYELVESVRTLVKQTVRGCTEEVKYGGIVFSTDVQFGGVFAYREHVSLEFSHGAKIDDPYGHLEGTGKGRRHIKLRSSAEVEPKRLAKYLPLAVRAASGA